VAALAAAKGPLAGIYSQLEADVTRLMPPNFIALYDLDRLPYLERYLQPWPSERALAGGPEKDRVKAEHPKNTPSG